MNILIAAAGRNEAIHNQVLVGNQKAGEKRRKNHGPRFDAILPTRYLGNYRSTGLRLKIAWRNALRSSANDHPPISFLHYKR